MQEKKSLIKERLKTILKDRIFISLVLGGLFLNMIVFAIAILFINFDQSAFILHYNVFFGIDKINFEFDKNPIELFLVPIGSVIIWLINLIIAFFLYLTSLREQLQYVEANKDIADKEGGGEKSIEKELYPKIFGAYSLLVSALIIAVVIGIYIVAVIMVNK